MAAAGILTENKSHRSPHTVGANETLMLRSFVRTKKYLSDNNNQNISSIAGQALGVEPENFPASTEQQFVRHVHSVLNDKPFVNKPICLDAPDDGDIWMGNNTIVHNRDVVWSVWKIFHLFEGAVPLLWHFW